MSTQPLEFGIVTAQDWRNWSTLLRQWQWAEDVGLDSAWLFDHFWSLRPTEDGPTLESWTLLAALAASTRRIRMGTQVSGVTHRYPAVLLKQAATVDQVSGGRLILGLGAGWVAAEHEAYGIPFPPPGQRVELVGETLEIARRAETEPTVTFAGRHVQLDRAPFEPKPVHGHIPVMIATGGRRMMRNVARYADYLETAQSPAGVERLRAMLAEACGEIGRDPGEIRLSVSAYYEHRATASNIEAPVIIWDGQPVAAVEQAVREHVAGYVAVGVRTFLFNVPPDAPNAALAHVATEVIPELRDEYDASS